MWRGDAGEREVCREEGDKGDEKSFKTYFLISKMMTHEEITIQDQDISATLEIEHRILTIRVHCSLIDDLLASLISQIASPLRVERVFYNQGSRMPLGSSESISRGGGVAATDTRAGLEVSGRNVTSDAQRPHCAGLLGGMQGAL